MRTFIKVRAENGLQTARLLTVIGQLTGVAFVATGSCEASLHIRGTSGPHTSPSPNHTLECSGLVARTEDHPVECVRVRFADHASVPWIFRGRVVSTNIPANCKPLLPLDGELVLASTESGPLWVVGSLAGYKNFRSALPLMDIPTSGSFSQVFCGATFMANLPLLHLLAQFTTSGIGIQQAPRATFMFDDPNLHWSSYGYVNYANLLQKAEQENFHVSFATIPLDSWFAHAKTSTQFRENPQRLSLLVHGNNHTRHELARETSPLGCTALLQQAQRRTKQLERRANVSVDRVMVPPHGACSANMLAALPGAGFEGACLSTGSLTAHNPNAEWIGTLGFRPAEQILGCPVLPRWALVGIEEAELLVAAYLGRPLVLRGHHGDLRDGIDVLTRSARFINGLGPVTWCSNAALMRSSYQLNMVGSMAYLRVFSREVTAPLPAGTTALVIEPSEWHATHERFVVAGAGSKNLTALAYQAVPLTADGDETVVQVTRSETSTRADSVPARGLDTSSVLRRILTEARDRLMPLTN